MVRGESSPYTPRPICPQPSGNALMNSTHTKLFLIVLLSLVLASSGCVRRRMTIRSNPPGAMVYVDDQQIGQTPVSTAFTYYGTRNITLVRDGFETMTVKHTFEAPWYQVPPLDFFSENLTLREIRDERILDFTLVPQQMVSSDQLWRNAENLRQSAGAGYVAPLPDSGRGNAPIGPMSLPPPPTAPNLNGPIYPTGDAGGRGRWR